jgi:hypothetical protein
MNTSLSVICEKRPFLGEAGSGRSANTAESPMEINSSFERSRLKSEIIQIISSFMLPFSIVTWKKESFHYVHKKDIRNQEIAREPSLTSSINSFTITINMDQEYAKRYGFRVS